MTKTIFFQTNTDLDLRALTTIGVSVKGPDSIGFFGSGFKYALATLLRTGHQIWVQELYQKKVKFESKPVIIRGKSFSLVTCDGAELGFTTDMGPNWQPWMALRELIANTKDENGVYGLEQLPGYKYTIAVTGDEILKAWKEVDSIFIPAHKTPIAKDDGIEIYEHFSPCVFYKGMRAGELKPAGVFTYNILCNSTLTEERNLYNPAIALSHGLRNVLFRSKDTSLVAKALSAPKESIEHGVDFDYKWHDKSETFMAVAKSLLGNGNVNSSLLRLFQDELEVSNAYTPTKEDLALLDQAWEVIEFMGYEKKPLNFIRSRSADLLGRFFDGKIFISDLAFRDLTTLVGTLYEEIVHQETGFADYTLQFQNFLVDQIVKYAMLAKKRS